MGGCGSSPRERGAPQLTSYGPQPSRLIPARAGSTNPPPPGRRRDSAHPRASGEHATASASAVLRFGSSPRERGARVRCRDRLDGPGLIPARAGSTAECVAGGTGPTAHPRASGEHLDGTRRRVPGDGSSPRERGAPAARSASTSTLRLIPARAGSTPPSRSAAMLRPAHPRASGEHGVPVGGGVVSDGSSPRERGAHGSDRRASRQHRLIPARGGSTGCSGSCSGSSSGSSPRERGAPDRRAGQGVERRLIPARAGSTSWTPTRVSNCSAHPRASGEHQGRVGSAAAMRRLIPARAGSTRRRRRWCTGTPAHPRASGEHTQDVGHLEPNYGSSPRERGARPRHLRGAGRLRLIPARAGSTWL